MSYPKYYNIDHHLDMPQKSNCTFSLYIKTQCQLVLSLIGDKIENNLTDLTHKDNMAKINSYQSDNDWSTILYRLF